MEIYLIVLKFILWLEIYILNQNLFCQIFELKFILWVEIYTLNQNLFDQLFEVFLYQIIPQLQRRKFIAL